MAQKAQMGAPIQVILPVADRQLLEDIAWVEERSMADVLREVITGGHTLGTLTHDSRRTRRKRWAERKAWRAAQVE